MRTKPKEGMRVQVYSADRADDLGLGTIEKVESLCDEEAWVVFTSSYPSRIALDSGEITEGMECWWIPLADVENEK